MFDQGGLSLNQAPPISVVFGLFLLGSVFGTGSGICILYYGVDIFDPSSTGAIVTTHLLALGVMMSFMFGALFQMLPVIAGIVLDAPIARSNFVKVLLTIGVLTLIMGFVTQIPMLFIFASIFLGSVLFYASWMMSSRLLRLSNHSASSRGILFALLSMLLFVLAALYLTTAYAQMHTADYFIQVKQLHYSFALFGWIALLIVSISFQTVEMFYVTPAYPRILSRYMPIGIFVLLLLLALSIIAKLVWAITLLQSLLYLSFVIYAGFTLLRLSQRKRPLADATIWFWRIGMSSLITSMVLLTMYIFAPHTLNFSLAAIFFVFFVLSVLFAMFYKIVPFLTWFHLNAQGYFTAPMMHEVIHPKTAKTHLWIHVSMLIGLLLSTVLHMIIYLAGILVILSFGWAGYQVLHAIKLYKHTQNTGERFDMNIDIQ